MVNWDRLKKPDGPFTPFVPKSKTDIEFWNKVVRFEKMLEKKPLFVSDEYRDRAIIEWIMKGYLYGGACNIFYEVGDFGGLVGFLNIREKDKASMMVKVWDRRVLTKQNVRDFIKLARTFVKEFKLKRLGIDTAHEGFARLAETAGMTSEGVLKHDFKWGGRYYDRHLLALYGEG